MSEVDPNDCQCESCQAARGSMPLADTMKIVIEGAEAYAENQDPAADKQRLLIKQRPDTKFEIIRDGQVIMVGNGIPQNLPPGASVAASHRAGYAQALLAATLGRSPVRPVSPRNAPGRNTPCPCGSGKKFKKCCGGQ